MINGVTPRVLHAASHGEAPPAAGEGRGGLVLCPRRGAPKLENVAASAPMLEKVSGGRCGGIYYGDRWRGAAVKNATTGERGGGFGNRHPTVIF